MELTVIASAAGSTAVRVFLLDVIVPGATSLVFTHPDHSQRWQLQTHRTGTCLSDDPMEMGQQQSQM